VAVGIFPGLDLFGWGGRARTRMMLSAKCGVRLTRNKNCFSPRLRAQNSVV
jgi:hypothetical protein